MKMKVKKYWRAGCIRSRLKHATFQASLLLISECRTAKQSKRSPFWICKSSTTYGEEFHRGTNPNRYVAASQTALGRVGLPDDIASAVAFLVSPEGRWVNGQILRVNGGIV